MVMIAASYLPADHGYRLLVVTFLKVLLEVAVVDRSMSFQTTVVQ